MDSVDRSIALLEAKGQLSSIVAGEFATDAVMRVSCIVDGTIIFESTFPNDNGEFLQIVSGIESINANVPITLTALWDELKKDRENQYLSVKWIK